MTHYLNSFRPLCITKFGRQAVQRYGLPPFQDASCRSEPSLDHSYPAITALCRKGSFAPRLHVGDRIVYITVHGNYEGIPDHWRLVAALEVIERFEMHAAAGAWYRSRGLDLPRNCMVDGNPPLALDRTANERKCSDLPDWDADYWDRAEKVGVFLICRTLALEMHSPRPLSRADFAEVFGRVPATRTPPSITRQQFEALLGQFSQPSGSG